ncbi:MAG TPA: hypothetical protein ACFYED_09800 [Candidatus Tripitaka californicus]|uniref:hypothetical protein n=1 Tax=Candidatus Tripitaka californicus TaxID=3367616 RepID=UPI004024F8DC|nr:hypothetical protein [Planctomycetota bacterium]
MLRVILILLLVFPMAGCASGPTERPEDMREQSMEWPSMRATEPITKESQARPTFEQR